MKLDRIKIDGYKNLSNFELHLDNFNVLIGRNNSGKSNFLEIFYLLQILFNGSDEQKKSLFAGSFPNPLLVFIPLHPGHEHPPLTIELDFNETVDDIEYAYFYKLQILCNRTDTKENEEGYVIEESFKYKDVKKTGMPKTIFSRNKSEVSRATGVSIKEIDRQESILSVIRKIFSQSTNVMKPIKVGIECVFQMSKTPVLYNSPNDIRRALLPLPNLMLDERRLSSFPLSNEIAKILDSENKEYFLEILDSVLGIKELEAHKLLNSSYILIGVTFSNGIHVLIDQVSDGTLVVLSLVTYLILNTSSILAIEELENSIHPKLLKELVMLIKREFKNTQIILTTHSPALIDLFDFDEVNIVFNDEKGFARLHKISEDRKLVKRLSGTFASFSDIFAFDDIFEENKEISTGEGQTDE